MPVGSSFGSLMCTLCGWARGAGLVISILHSGISRNAIVNPFNIILKGTLHKGLKILTKNKMQSQDTCDTVQLLCIDRYIVIHVYIPMSISIYVSISICISAYIYMYIYTSLYIYAPGAVSGGVEECTLNTRLLIYRHISVYDFEEHTCVLRNRGQHEGGFPLVFYIAQELRQCFRRFEVLDCLEPIFYT